MPAREGARRLWRAVCLSPLDLCLAFAAMAICGYRFGIADQAQYLVQVLDVEQPGALAGDPYADVFRAMGSVFWIAIAAITSEANRPLIFMLLTFAITWANIVLLRRICEQLIPCEDPAAPRARHSTALLATAPALLLVVPKEQNWFGLVTLSDVELTSTFAVLPLVFGALLCWISSRPWRCLLLCLLCVPMQGQTGVAMLVAWWFGMCWLQRRRPFQRLAVVSIGVAGATALLAAARLSTMSEQAVDEYYRIGAGLYAPLIDPLTAPPTAWAGVFAVLALGIAAALAMSTRAPIGRPSDPARLFMCWWIASMLFPLLGIALLALGVEEPILWKLMVGRALMLPQLAAIIALAVWCVRMLRSSIDRAAKATIVLTAATLWPFPNMAPVTAAMALLTVLVLILSTARSSPVRIDRIIAPRRSVAGLAVACACALAMGAHAFVHRAYPWLRVGDDPAWIDVQRWARTNTPEQSLFITPPYRSGWRLGSHRPTFGEIKDGGLFFYAGAPAMEWTERMSMLGLPLPAQLRRHGVAIYDPLSGGHDAPHRFARDAYHRALLRNAHRLADRFGAMYIVTEADADVRIGPAVWTNDAFVVRRIASRTLASTTRR